MLLEDYDWLHHYPCPSVMEMLDIMPTHINADNISISTDKWRKYYVKFWINYTSDNSLPNALADMVIWLVENKHLSFNK